MPKLKWKPRSSQLGAYLSCMYRAAFDRALADGLMTLEPHDEEAVKEARKSSPYAAFGTWCHFYLQDALRCEFEGGREDHVPDADTKGAAANLFNGDPEAAEAAVRTAVTVAAKNMPIPMDGKPWIAEAACKSKNLNGHLDFLSQDREDIVDLKMTSKKPAHGMCKAEHFAQVAGAYPLLVRERFGVLPKRATILYVDMHATWACPVVIDLTTPERMDYINQINDYAAFLRSAALFKAAAPCIGPHCSDGWCPYTSICKNRILPPPGNFTDHGLPPVPNMKITGL
jgi:hypothetical protein